MRRSGRSDTYWSVTGRGGGVSAQISPGSHRASTGPSQAYALYQGMAFSRAVGGSQFRALAPAACFLARYANQYGNSSATRPVRSSIASRSCHHQGLKPYAFRGSARLKPCPDTNQIITSRSRKLRASTRVSTRHAKVRAPQQHRTRIFRLTPIGVCPGGLPHRAACYWNLLKLK